MNNSSESKSGKILFVPLSHLPILAGLSYILGFIVIANRLIHYGIAPTDLFEAQYFAAGFVPCLIVYMLYWIVRLTWKPEETSEKLRQLLRACHQTVFKAGVIVVAVLWVTQLLVRGDNGAVFLTCYAASSSLGLFALGVLSYQVRRWWKGPYFYNPYALAGFIDPKRNREKSQNMFSAGFSLAYIACFLVTAYSEATFVYQTIPQSLGGGKFASVRMVVDAKYVPSDLAGEIITAETVYTKPLSLVFRSQKGYVALDEKNRTWFFPADTVHTISTDVTVISAEAPGDP